ncbi:hypothetical protein BD410DRAFT_55930 [Rickenella mellea]|uniref:Uncharacterized protein n=1 Tax=Rickenella mellea TaxID=50990 RepID=A0A4R5XG84_9AGAM|nr:hypothetical protein BD410DRAFT_55930 [Rickenella mellea]
MRTHTGIQEMRRHLKCGRTTSTVTNHDRPADPWHVCFFPSIQCLMFHLCSEFSSCNQLNALMRVAFFCALIRLGNVLVRALFVVGLVAQAC